MTEAQELRAVKRRMDRLHRQFVDELVGAYVRTGRTTVRAIMADYKRRRAKGLSNQEILAAIKKGKAS